MVASKEAVRNSYCDILYAIICDKSQILSGSSKQGHMKCINPKFATESEFNHIQSF